MTVYVSHVAAVPGPVLPLLILAALGRLVADGWPRHVRVIHDEPETTT